MKQIAKNKKRLRPLLLGLSLCPAVAIGQDYVIMSSNSMPAASSGPTVAAQVTTALTTAGGAASLPATTVRFSLSNQQFTSIEGNPGIPGAVIGGGVTTNLGDNTVPPENVFQAFSSWSYVNGSDYVPCNNGCNTATDPSFKNNTYGIKGILYTDALIDANSTNLVPTSSRVQYADLTLTFDRPVYQPIIHLGSLGGFYKHLSDTIGFTTDLDLVTPGLTATILSGANLSIDGTNTKLYNNAATYGSATDGTVGGGYAASGSVRINSAAPITTLTFRLYLHGDGRTGQWSTGANEAGGVVMGDGFLMSVSMDRISLSGNVYADANGQTDNIVNGNGINMPSGQQVYVNLIDAQGKVYASTPVAADGSYSFPAVIASEYTAQLSVNQGVVGNAMPATALPADWVNTGEYIGIGAGNDATADGLLTIAPTTSNVNDINLGIDHKPVAQAKLFASVDNTYFDQYKTVGGTHYVGIPMTSAGLPASSYNNTGGSLSGTDTEDCPATNSCTTGSTFVINTIDANTMLMYNGVQITPGQTITNFDPALMVIYGGEGESTIGFTYSMVDKAGQSSSAVNFGITVPTPLPIYVESFDVMKKGQVALLNWLSASDERNGTFGIERSRDGQHNWQTLSVVPVQDIVSRSSAALTYSYTDQMPEKGDNYYRLRMLSADGMTRYTAIRKVNFAAVQAITATPNPFHEQLNIGGLNGGERVFVVDMLGKTQLDMTIPADTKEQTLQLSELSQGMYHVLIYDTEGNRLHSVKVSKQ